MEQPVAASSRMEPEEKLNPEQADPDQQKSSDPVEPEAAPQEAPPSPPPPETTVPGDDPEAHGEVEQAGEAEPIRQESAPEDAAGDLEAVEAGEGEGEPPDSARDGDEPPAQAPPGVDDESGQADSTAAGEDESNAEAEDVPDQDEQTEGIPADGPSESNGEVKDSEESSPDEVERSAALNEPESVDTEEQGFSTGGAPGGVIPAPEESSSPAQHGRARGLPIPRILLLSNAILVLALVGGVLWVRPWSPRTAVGVQRTERGVLPGQSSPSHVEPPFPPGADGSSAPQMLAQPPLSWIEAEKALLGRRYALALQGYAGLLAQSKRRPENETVTDFLTLRMARCFSHLGRNEEADRCYAKVIASTSPVVRAVGQYQLGVRDLLNGQFMRARMRAYLAIADLAALDVPLALEADCDFLIARAVTEKVLTYYGASESINWQPLRTADPFAGLGQSDLRRLLLEGRGRTNAAPLGPRVTRAASEAGGRKFDVACTRGSIESLLGHFAGKAELELKWASVTPAARSRSISIRYTQVSEQRLSEVSCGAVGLLARYTGDAIIVHDPQSYTVLSQQRDLLAKEASAVWRRTFLRTPDDPRIPEAHLAYAVLQEHSEEVMGAIREYQLIVQRFQEHPVAPAALLQSAEMRIRMRDYTGARLDLLNLLDRYPNHLSSERVYLYLGEATMKAGLLDNAIRVFRKLFYMNLSSESRRKACLGAMRCFDQTGNPSEVRKWAMRYIGLVKSPEDDLAEAYVLLGKSEAASGNMAEAGTAFRLALLADPPRDLHVATILALADAEAAQDKFLAAVGMLQRLGGLTLTPAQSVQALSTTARIYREMGIPEKGAVLLRRQLGSVGDPQLRAELAAELGRCYVAEGDLQAGGQVLAEFLPKMKPGPMAQDCASRLAEICLKLGKARQAIVLSTSVLRSDCSAEVRKRTREILGSAYVSQGDYDRAALALSGLMFKQEEAEE